MRKKVSIGDVFRIELENGKYVFGRVYKDATVGIYDYISDNPEEPPIGLRNFSFFVGIYDYILKNRVWPIIGCDPFKNEDDSWPPKRYIFDTIELSYSIYYKGEIIKSTKEECLGLEHATVWEAEHVVGRLNGDENCIDILKA